MTGAAALLLATIVSLELSRRLHLLRAFAMLGREAPRATRLLVRTGVSEWTKERALRLMAARLFGLSGRAGLLLAVVALPLALVLALDPVLRIGARSALVDWHARLWLLALTTGYAVARRRAPAGPGRGDRLLQTVALGSRPLLDISFDIERGLYGRAAAAIPVQAPVFVTGLARAGTTVLMRVLHESGTFASSSYRDLPFPLAQNAWARLTRGAVRHVALAERGHGDGIFHDLDSPEAIEELFWRCKEGERYRTAEGLAPVQPLAGSLDEFGDHVRLTLLRYRRARYLSKNNNNVLRLPALVATFPDALLVHPFRDPLQQAASLLHQHVRACALAAEDPYRRRFMTWLGHHEFGADRRAFLLPAGPAQSDDPIQLGYWLKLWIAVYQSLLEQPPAVRARQILVDYDRLCAEPDRLAEPLARRLGIAEGFDLSGMRAPAARDADFADKELVRACYALHLRLRLRSEAALGREGAAGADVA